MSIDKDLTGRGHGRGRARGRPVVSDEQRAQMRLRIEQVARALFKEEGYGQVSIRKIAKGVGCSPMTLYKYYDSKIDILRTLWTDIFNEVFDRMAQVNRLERSATDVLNETALIYVNYWLENTDHYRLVFMAEGVTQTDVGLFVDNPDLSEKYTVFSELLLLIGKGKLSQQQLKLKSDVLMCGLHGIAHNMITISSYPWENSHELISELLAWSVDDDASLRL